VRKKKNCETLNYFSQQQMKKRKKKKKKRDLMAYVPKAKKRKE
jgi:hypothetical protein